MSSWLRGATIHHITPSSSLRGAGFGEEYSKKQAESRGYVEEADSRRMRAHIGSAKIRAI